MVRGALIKKAGCALDVAHVRCRRCRDENAVLKNSFLSGNLKKFSPRTSRFVDFEIFGFRCHILCVRAKTPAARRRGSRCFCVFRGLSSGVNRQKDTFYPLSMLFGRRFSE